MGGGISGLATAIELVRSGTAASITVFDAQDRVGGMLRTTHTQQRLVEHSADMFTTKLPFASQLCETIGYSDQLISTTPENRGARLVTPRGLQPIPTGFSLMVPKQVLPILRSPILSYKAKLRLLLEPAYAMTNRRFGNGIDRDESLMSFSIRHWGREIFDKLIQPLVAGIYTADPARLSMEAALPEFVEMERRHGRLLWAQAGKPDDADGDFQDSLSAAGRREARVATGARYGLFQAPRQGMQHWMDAIRTWLHQRGVRFVLDSTVTQVRRQKDSWILDRLSDESVVFDGLVVATPVGKAAELLHRAHGKLAEQLELIESASAAIVVSDVPRDSLPNKGQKLGYGLVVPEYLKRSIIASSFSSNKFAGRSQDDRLLVRSFFGGALHPEYLELGDSELIELAREELSDLLSAPNIKLDRTMVVRWHNAMPQYHVGHLDRVETIEKLVEASHAFGLAGNAYRGVGIPQCIESGNQAARKLLRDLSRR